MSNVTARVSKTKIDLQRHAKPRLSLIPLGVIDFKSPYTTHLLLFFFQKKKKKGGGDPSLFTADSLKPTNKTKQKKVWWRHPARANELA